MQQVRTLDFFLAPFALHVKCREFFASNQLLIEMRQLPTH